MIHIITLERIIAIACLTHIIINLIRAAETVKVAIELEGRWEYRVEFTTIAAFLLSGCAVVRWALSV